MRFVIYLVFYEVYQALGLARSQGAAKQAFLFLAANLRISGELSKRVLRGNFNVVQFVAFLGG